MKFGQLMDYSIRNIFLEKSYTKFGVETIPRLFPVLYTLFLFFAKLSTIEKDGN